MTNEEFIASVSLENEKWKDIPNYEGYYCASTKGRIISLGRRIKTVNGWRYIRPKLLVQRSVDSTGYYRVNLRKGDKTYTRHIHRLIATTFLPNPLNKPEVDHIDTNKKNNKVENLRWCFPKENMRNPLTMQHMQDVVYSNSIKHRKLSRPVASIKDGDIVKTYPSLKSVFEDGYNPDCVWNCCNGVTKTHKGLQWKYLTNERIFANQ